MASQPGILKFSRRNFAPVIYLDINNRPANDLLRVLVSFNYSKTIKKSADTTFVFRNDYRNLMEDARFLSNVTWRFRYGFFNDLSPIITGQIRQVEPVYADRRIVTVKLKDLSIQLSKSSEGKNWGRVRSSDIAMKLAKKYEMQAEVETTEDVPENDYVQPAMINDLEYLRDLAADIDYEVIVEGNPPTLVYRSRQYDAPADPRKIIYYDDASEFAFVKSFKPKIKSLGEQKSGSSKTDAATGKGKQNTDNKADEHFQPNQQSSGVITLPEVTIIGEVPSGVVNLPGVQITGSVRYEIDANSKQRRKVIKTRSRDLKAVSKPAPSTANTRVIARARRQQLLDTAQEASSAHPLTASFVVGRHYEWDGLDKPLNRKWYCTGFTCSITGNSQDTTVEWKRDDPNQKMGKGGVGAKNQGVITLPEITIIGNPPRVQIDPSRGRQSNRRSTTFNSSGVTS